MEGSERWQTAALIGVGGFLGATLRHAVALALPTPFPFGTLVANAAGTFLLGLLLYEAHAADRISAETRLLAGTGFCSSFTTYSTFAAETAHLSAPLAAANVGANYTLGFLAVGLGQVVARWVS